MTRLTAVKVSQKRALIADAERLVAGRKGGPTTPPAGNIIWTDDAYPSGDFQLWSAQQEMEPDRCTIVTPPAEVGGGPRGRSTIARFRINATDVNPLDPEGGAQRAEASRNRFVPTVLPPGPWGQGGEIYAAFEQYFGQPGVVAEENAFRPCPNTWWNTFMQFHQDGDAGTVPCSFNVRTEAGPNPSDWVMGPFARGGQEVNMTSMLWCTVPFAYGWTEWKIYLKWGQAGVGRITVWYNGTQVWDRVGVPVGYTDSPYTYPKQGMYRGKFANNMTCFSAGLRFGDTEAIVS